eukprot:SAG31_NODE_7250_length_1742_cov_1.572733_3_plen_50_part_00
MELQFGALHGQLASIVSAKDAEGSRRAAAEQKLARVESELQKVIGINWG